MPKFLLQAAGWTGAGITVTVTLRQVLPRSWVWQQIIGIKFYNRSLFDVLVFGFPGVESFNLQPFSEIYIPNTTQIELTATSPLTFISSLNDVLNPFMSTQEGSSIDLLLFFVGDPEPSEAYIPVFRAQNTIVAAPINLQDVNTAFTAQISAGSSSTNILQVAAAAPAHLWMTQLSVQFGVPGTAGNADCTLIAGDGTQYEQLHCNLGVAPMPPFKEVLNYVNPLKVSTVAGTAKFTFSVPAVASGPAYSVNMKGYIFSV